MLVKEDRTLGQMREYISNNYKKLQNMAKSIAKEDFWEDLLHETITNLLVSKRFNQSIFDEKREFVFIYGIMKFDLYKKNCAFIKKFRYFEISPEYNQKNRSDYLPNDQYDFKKEVIFNSIYEYLNMLYSSGAITTYDFKLFIIYFFQDKITKHEFKFNKKKEKILLEGKNTYRKIGKVTGINYQTVRLSVIKTLKKINKDFNFDREMELDPTTIIKIKNK